MHTAASCLQLLQVMLLHEILLAICMLAVASCTAGMLHALAYFFGLPCSHGAATVGVVTRCWYSLSSLCRTEAW